MGLKNKQVKARFELRADTYENWSNVNPVLRSGEPSLDVTNNVFKIGDGVTNWLDLPTYSTVEALPQYNLTYSTLSSDTAGRWHVNIPGIKELTDGLTIRVMLTTSYNSTYNTLTINNLEEKIVWFRYNTRLTTHFGQNCILDLTYKTDAGTYTTGGKNYTDGWIITANYDTTNTYQMRYDTRRYAGNAVYARQLVAQTMDNHIVSFSNSNNTSKTDKQYLDVEFNLLKGILYYGDGNNLATGAGSSNSALWKQYSIDTRYTFNTSNHLTAYAAYYLKCVPTGGGNGHIDTTDPFTKTLPTTDDGFVYKFLGLTYSTTNLDLIPEQTCFWFKDGKLRVYTGIENATTTSAGLMSALDKEKLDTLENYVHDTHDAHGTLDLYKISNDNKGHITAATKVTKADITALGIPAQDNDTTYTLSGSNAKITLTDRSGGKTEHTVNNVAHATAADTATTATSATNATNATKLNGIDYTGYAKLGEGNYVSNSNSFNPYHLYIHDTDNGFWSLDKRYTVTGVEYTANNTKVRDIPAAQISNLFDYNFDSRIDITRGNHAVFTLEFGNDGMPQYPYGKLFVSFYYNNIPATITAREYNLYEPHTIGWSDLPATRLPFPNEASNCTYMFSQNKYQIKTIEFTITAKSDINCAVTQIEWIGNRLPITQKQMMVKNAPMKTYFSFDAAELKENGTSLSNKYQAKGTYVTAVHTLKTDNETSLPVQENESLNGSGVTSLHKISKTGSYNDLLDKPSIPDGSTFVHKTGDEEINGVKTFNAPAMAANVDQASVKINTANGGSIWLGKEGANSGTMLRLDQADGTPRLRFRASSSAGAVVWDQPETGASVCIDMEGPANRITINKNTINALNHTGKFKQLQIGNKNLSELFANISHKHSYNDLDDKPTIPDPKNYYWANMNISDTGSTTTSPTFGTVKATKIETGATADSYFQTQRMRGEGTATTYYHAVDWGFAGHNKVDFYEYGGEWNFNKCTSGNASNITQILHIGDDKLTYKGSDVALKSDIPAAPTIDSAMSDDSTNAVQNKVVKSYVDSRIGSGYKAGGSIAPQFFAEALQDYASRDETGYVHNVTADFTTDDSFVEGAGKSYTAGTNIVEIKDGTVFKWDVLSGFVDLSNYVQKTDTINKAKDADTVDGKHAADFAAASHTHTIANVTNLQTNLDSKMNKITSTDWAIPAFSGTAGDLRNTGVKLDSSNNLITPSYTNYTFQANSTTAYSTSPTQVAATAMGRATWHNRFSFLTNSQILSSKVTTDGTNWTDASFDARLLFLNKENQSVQVLATTDLAYELIIGNFPWSSISWMELNYTDAATVARTKVKIEAGASVNPATWTLLHESEAQNNASTRFCYMPNLQGNNCIKITITKTTNTTTAAVKLSSIKGWSSRKGDQGQGIEDELPFKWDATPNLLPKITDSSNLGTTNTRWNGLYAKSLNIDNGGIKVQSTGGQAGHLILTGGHTNSSTQNITQIVMKRGDRDQWALTANDGVFIVNPTVSSTTGQLTYNFSSSQLKLGGKLVSMTGHTHTMNEITDLPDLTNYVTLNGEQTISGTKYFSGGIRGSGIYSSLAASVPYITANGGILNLGNDWFGGINLHTGSNGTAGNVRPKWNSKELAIKDDIPTVVDNLTSESATSALSAKQGNQLNTDINAIGEAMLNKADREHTHSIGEVTNLQSSLDNKQDKLTTKTFNVTGAVNATAQNYDGTQNVNIPISSVKESYLTWGGKNFTGTYGPLDAAMIGSLGANRLAFLGAAGVTVEYSRDNGTTWTTYPNVTDAQKNGLFSAINQNFVIGADASKNAGSPDKSQYQVRFTLEFASNKCNVYTELNKFVVYISTSGSQKCWCSIDGISNTNVKAGYFNDNTKWTNYANKVAISGWSGYNIINTSGITTYGNSDWQNKFVRFTFGVTTHAANTAYQGLTVYTILGFGGVGWTTNSNLARINHLYNYDANQNALFPAAIKEGSSWLSDKYAAKTHTHTKAQITDFPTIPTKTSQLSNDSGFVTSSHTHTDLDTRITTNTTNISGLDTRLTTVEGTAGKTKFDANFAYPTNTADTAGRWTVSIPEITELKDGLTITVFLTKSYNGTYNTLKVNDLPAKVCWNRYNSRLTSHYGQYSVLRMTYKTECSSSGYTHDGITNDKTGWLIENYYDSTNTWDYRLYGRRKTTTKLVRNQLVGQTRQGDLVTFCETDNSTATTKTVYQREFDFTKQMIYYGTTANIAANAYTAENVLWLSSTVCELRYTFNLGSTLVANNYYWLKIQPNSTGNGIGKVADMTHPVVNALPTTDDGFVYKFLGIAASTNTIRLALEQPCYWFKDGAIREYDPLYSKVSENSASIDGIGTLAQSKVGNSSASVTDNRVARFDGTSGRLIQDSKVTIDDNGNISAGYLQGSWLKMSSPTAGYNIGSSPYKVAVIRNDGWVYVKDSADFAMKSDIRTRDIYTINVGGDYSCVAHPITYDKLPSSFLGTLINYNKTTTIPVIKLVFTNDNIILEGDWHYSNIGEQACAYFNEVVQIDGKPYNVVVVATNEAGDQMQFLPVGGSGESGNEYTPGTVGEYGPDDTRIYDGQNGYTIDLSEFQFTDFGTEREQDDEVYIELIYKGQPLENFKTYKFKGYSCINGNLHIGVGFDQLRKTFDKEAIFRGSLVFVEDYQGFREGDTLISFGPINDVLCRVNYSCISYDLDVFLDDTQVYLLGTIYVSTY